MNGRKCARVVGHSGNALLETALSPTVLLAFLGLPEFALLCGVSRTCALRATAAMAELTAVEIESNEHERAVTEFAVQHCVRVRRLCVVVGGTTWSDRGLQLILQNADTLEDLDIACSVAGDVAPYEPPEGICDAIVECGPSLRRLGCTFVLQRKDVLRIVGACPLLEAVYGHLDWPTLLTSKVGPQLRTLSMGCYAPLATPPRKRLVLPADGSRLRVLKLYLSIEGGARWIRVTMEAAARLPGLAVFTLFLIDSWRPAEPPLAGTVTFPTLEVLDIGTAVDDNHEAEEKESGREPPDLDKVFPRIRAPALQVLHLTRISLPPPHQLLEDFPGLSTLRTNHCTFRAGAGAGASAGTPASSSSGWSSLTELCLHHSSAAYAEQWPPAPALCDLVVDTCSLPRTATLAAFLVDGFPHLYRLEISSSFGGRRPIAANHRRTHPTLESLILQAAAPVPREDIHQLFSGLCLPALRHVELPNGIELPSLVATVL